MLGLGAPFGMDFGAVMTMGAALGADAELVASLLPVIEPILVARFRRDDDDGSEEE